MRWLLNLLGSLRLTLALLIGLGALFGLGLVVPQKAVLQRELYEQWRAQRPGVVAALELAGLTDIHRSPVAAVLWGAFFANLAFVMVRRIPGTVRRVRVDGDVPDPVSAAGFTFRVIVAARPGALDRARGFFEERGYAVYEGNGRLRAVKNRLAPLATLGFHLSFFLVAAGVAVSVATRFEGTVDLGQGETFTGALEQYASPPRLPRFGRPPAPRFTVEWIDPQLIGDVPVAMRVQLRDDTFRLSTLEVNRPYRAGGASFVFKNLGVAPALVVTDSEGRELFAGLMRLNVLQGRTDRFELLGLRFTADFFPDYMKEGEAEGTRSQEFHDPVLRLRAVASNGATVTASLRPGEAMRIGPYTLAFVDWRYWVRLYVRAERGLWLIWLGFALGSVALTWRLFFFRREYVAGITEGGAGVALAGRAEYYRALFSDEAAGVANALERALARTAEFTEQ